MEKTFIVDEWDYNTAGGCQNFGMYSKNPVFVLQLPTDSEIIVRMSIVGEVSPDGSTLITDYKNFNFACNA